MPPCDTRTFIEQLGGDADLARQMARTYLRQADRLMAAVRSALDARDADALRRAAHALRGSAANFGAAPTGAAAADLEGAGRSGNLAGADALFAQLELEAERLVVALRDFAGVEPCAS